MLKQIIDAWVLEDGVEVSADGTKFMWSDDMLNERANRISARSSGIEDLSMRARLFASLAHNKLCRKFERIPYIEHPIRVATRVAALPKATPELIAAAYLHDVREDCGVTDEVLRAAFGPLTADFVSDLTNRFKDAKDANGKLLPRKERKRLEFARIQKIRTESKWVKLIDRIDNLTDMKQNPDWDFVKVYKAEAQQLIEVAGDADVHLKDELQTLINSIK